MEIIQASNNPVPGNTSWRDRLHGDPLRTLLADEARLVGRLGRPLTIAPEAIPADPLNLPPSSEALCFREICRGVSPSDDSFLVFQAGRFFLVGPTEAAVETLLRDWPGGSQKFAETYLHVVLLTWDRNHVGGLVSLLRARSEANQRLTLWTAEWIWNELVLHFASSEKTGMPHEHRTIALDCLQRLDRLAIEQAKVLYESADAPGIVNAKVLFENQMDIRFTLGTGMQMDFVLAPQPALRVRFDCNHLSITLDPLNQVDSVDDLNIIEQKLREEYVHSRRWEPPFRDLFYRRFGQLRDRWRENGTGHLRYWPGHTPCSAKHRECSTNPGYRVPCPPQEWHLDDPVDCAMLGREFAKIKFRPVPPQSLQTTVRSRSAPLSAEGKLRIALAIQCGGLVDRKKRELLDPGRTLNFLIDNKPASLLVWRLTEIQKWTNAHANSLDARVLIMTSPDTIDVVEREKARFEKDFQPSGDPQPALLQIDIIPQQLVPRVTGDISLTTDAAKDGGWRLDARGHGDFIAVLQQWCGQQPKEMIPNVCVAFAYNNLGRLFTEKENDTTVRNIRDFLAAGQHRDAVFGVELFTFEATDGVVGREADLSFARQPVQHLESVRLLKRTYLDEPSAPFSPPLQVSSHTWYVHCELLTKIQMPQLYLFTSQGTGRWPRCDMEQACYLSDGSVLALLDTGGQLGTGAHKWERYQVARTEDELRNETFLKLLGFDREASVQLQPPPLAETMPAKRIAVWGGPELARRKSWPNEDIAETWEISTHAAGPSQVHGRWGLPVSLKSLASSQGQGHLPYMIKYLDCHQPLSIQLHPNRSAIAQLIKLKLHLPVEVKDDGHKEESFFVIKCAERPFHLFLGFELDKLRPIADPLRPLLARWLNQLAGFNPEQLKSNLNDFYKELIDKFHSLFRPLARVVCDALQDVQPHVILDAAFGNGVEAERLKQVLCYHVEDAESSLDEGINLLGKEYLFAGIGVLRFIAALRPILADLQPGTASRQRALELYGNPSGQEVVATNSPLLDFFHSVKISPGQWCRVPPGTIHAWQGGGNLLIELSHRSDNTFRCFDYGRELCPKPPRTMHYWEAMYSLTMESLLGAGLEERLIFKAETRFPPFEERRYNIRRSHAILNYQFFTGRPAKAPATAPAWQKVEEPGDIDLQGSSFSVFLNPGHAIHLRSGNEEPDLKVGACRAVLVHHPNGKYRAVEFLRERSDECLLHVYPSTPRPSLLCLSLGETKLEVALWESGQSPAIVWQRCVPEKTPSASDRLRNAFRSLFIGANKLIGGRQNHGAKMELAIAWPGHVRARDNLDSTTYGLTTREGVRAALDDVVNDLPRQSVEDLRRVTFWEKATHDGKLHVCDESLYILADATLAALGEHRHPLGALAGTWHRDSGARRRDTHGSDVSGLREPCRGGMALNIGSGVCAGFYDEDSFREPSGDLNGKTLAAICAVGRWLSVDPKTARIERNINYQGDWASDLVAHVFSNHDPALDSRIRLSPYLSSRGLAIRFVRTVSKIDKQKSEELLRKGGLDSIPTILDEKGATSPERFVNACNAILDHTADFRPHSLFYQIDLLASDDSNDRLNATLRQTARSFIVLVGGEIAEIIHHIRSLLSDLQNDKHSGGRLSVPPIHCLDRVVLTGIVGQAFGWAGEEDLLCKTVNHLLSRDADNLHFSPVDRSRIAIASVRETEGFQYFLTRWRS